MTSTASPLRVASVRVASHAAREMSIAVTRAPRRAATSDTAPLPQPTSKNVRSDSAIRDTVRQRSTVEKNSFGGNTPTGTAIRSPLRRATSVAETSTMPCTAGRSPAADH